MHHGTPILKNNWDERGGNVVATKIVMATTTLKKKVSSLLREKFLNLFLLQTHSHHATQNDIHESNVSSCNDMVSFMRG